MKALPGVWLHGPPCSSTFLSSDDVSEFHFLVGLLLLHIPMAPQPAKENHSTIKWYARTGLAGQWWEWGINLTYNSSNGARSVPSKSVGWDGRS